MGAMALASLSAYASAAVEECVTNYSATTDYFPAEAGAKVTEARKFTIDYFPGYKIVTNVANKRQYVLYPCGAPEPDVTDLALPTGYQRRTLSVPAQKVVTAETVSYDFLNLLQNEESEMGVTDRLISLSSYATDACAQKALACTDNTVQPGVSAAVPGWGAKPEDYDVLMSAAGVYFDYAEQYKGTGADKTVIFSATSETSLLGRGEWLKYVGAFFNMDHTAEKAFAEMRAKYYGLVDEAKANPSRPKVAFLDIDTYSSKDNDLFTVSLAGYKRSAVLDAGGFIANVEDFAGLTGVTIATNMRGAQVAVPKAAGDARDAALVTFKALLKDTDIIVDEHYSPTPLTRDQALAAFGLTAEDTAYPFIADGKLFRQDKTGSASGSAWFEQGVSRPDLVLKDFIKVIHPESKSVATHRTFFLRDLFAGETKDVQTAKDCVKAYPICGLTLSTPAPICPPDSFKTCADGSKVFLTSSSDCSKYEYCPAAAMKEEGYKGLPASSNIILAVFMSFVGCLLLAAGFQYGKKQAAAKAAGSPGGLAVAPGAAGQLH